MKIMLYLLPRNDEYATDSYEKLIDVDDVLVPALLACEFIRLVPFADCSVFDELRSYSTFYSVQEPMVYIHVRLSSITEDELWPEPEEVNGIDYHKELLKRGWKHDDPRSGEYGLN